MKATIKLNMAFNPLALKFIPINLTSKMKNGKAYLTNNSIILFKEDNNSILIIENYLLYKKSRDEKGNINLSVYIDFKKLSILPILKLESKLLTPLIFTDSTNNSLLIVEKMLYQLYHTPHLFTVKNFILNNLSNNSIKITSNILNNKEENKIKKNKLVKLNDIYFKDCFGNDKLVDENLNKPGVYIYSFSVLKNKIDCHYIGSSINIKNRLRSHKQSTYFSVYSEESKDFIEYNNLTDIDNEIKFKCGSIYITKDYLQEFKKLYPNYTLSKGEWLILNKITDLHYKILELSMIYNLDEFKTEKHFNSFSEQSLNKDFKVAYRFSEWKKEWLFLYDKESGYRKATKVIVYMLVDNKSIIGFNIEDLVLEENKSYEFNFYNKAKTLATLCDRYYGDMEFLFKIVNKKKYYKIPLLRYPIRIVEEHRNIEIEIENVQRIRRKSPFA
jgi:hypothetical protein